MATKRMFSKQIIDSDAFLDMPQSTQNLYFHLAMRADDDGFVNSPKRVMRLVGCNEDDMKVLLTKRFILAFESGLIVIKHWKIHNYIQKDRYHPTVYQDEYSRLEIKDNGAYTESKNSKNSVSKLDTSCTLRLDKIRLDKVRLDELDTTNPTREEVSEFCKENDFTFDVDRFYDKYKPYGWKYRGQPFDWKDKAREWQAKEPKQPKQKKYSKHEDAIKCPQCIERGDDQPGLVTKLQPCWKCGYDIEDVEGEEND